MGLRDGSVYGFVELPLRQIPELLTGLTCGSLADCPCLKKLSRTRQL